MIEKQTDEMSSWASSRGLMFSEKGLLPPETEFLRQGLGVGEHRSSLTVARVGKSLTETSWKQKRPERASLNFCEGRLPGDLSGVLAHHVFLSDHGSGFSNGDEERYQARVGTVVFARLPVRSRASFNLRLGRPADFKSGATIGGTKESSDDPLESIYLVPTGRHRAGDFEFTTWPAEPDERMNDIAGSEVVSALGELPPETRVECESGALCVYIKGDAVSDPALLDNLCRFASALADSLIDVVARTPALEAGVALGPAPDTPRNRWLGRGADLVKWDSAPPSVLAAQQAYEPVIASRASKSGWSIFGVASIAILLISTVLAGAFFLGSLIFDTRIIGVIGAVIIMALGIRTAAWGGQEAGIDAKDDRIKSTTIPWGLEAFAREYASASGLEREDAEELRRRLPVPVPGRAQMAWHGDLGKGVPGHLAIWIDTNTDPEDPAFWLIAAVGEPLESEGPLRFANIDGFGIAGWQVDSVSRSGHRLDEFRKRVVASVKAGPTVSSSGDRDSLGRPKWSDQAG